jgi:WD40 repeat protein
MYPSTRIGVYGLDGERQAVLSLPPFLYGTTKRDDDPAGWSDDGESILVQPSAGEIWEVPVDGGPPRRLPVDYPSSTLWRSRSPDGGRVAYAAGGELIVAAADGSEPRALASGASEQWGTPPAWSPAGDRIAFVAGESDLRVVDVANGAVTLLARGGVHESVGALEFSPEGDRILFARDNDAGMSSIWSVSASGSEPQLLISGVDWRTGDWQSLQADPPSSATHVPSSTEGMP